MSRILLILSTIFIFVYSQNAKNIKNDCENIEKNKICKTQISYKEELNLKEGWNIVGISYDVIDVEKFLAQKCILNAKKLVNGAWKEYDSLNKNTNIEQLKSNDALYIYSTSDCLIVYDGVLTLDKNKVKLKAIVVKSNIKIDDKTIVNIINDTHDKNTTDNEDVNISIIKDENTTLVEEDNITKKSILNKEMNNTEINTSK